MNLLIADTFADSLTRLTADEQKAVKVTIFDLHANPSAPGLQLHRVDQAKDPNFWSARVNRDVRLILHRTSSSTRVCYIDHHDDAYRWAEKRKVEVHPTTGAAQLVEVRERVEEVVVPVFVPEAAPTSTASKPRLFGTLTQDELLGWGVPPEPPTPPGRGQSHSAAGRPSREDPYRLWRRTKAPSPPAGCALSGLPEDLVGRPPRGVGLGSPRAPRWGSGSSSEP
jgi:hypothetical protein